MDVSRHMMGQVNRRKGLEQTGALTRLQLRRHGPRIAVGEVDAFEGVVNVARLAHEERRDGLNAADGVFGAFLASAARQIGASFVDECSFNITHQEQKHGVVEHE